MAVSSALPQKYAVWYCGKVEHEDIGKRGLNVSMTVVLCSMLCVFSAVAFGGERTSNDCPKPSVILPEGWHPPASLAITSDEVMQPDAFNKIWEQECRDSGERVTMHLINDNPPPYLKNGSIFLVSDHYRDAGYKCYRTSTMQRLILKKDGDYFRIVSTVRGNPWSSFNNGYHAGIYDFLSTDIQADVSLYRLGCKKNGSIDVIIKEKDGLLSGAEFDSSSGYYTLFHLTRDGKDRYLREDVGLFTPTNSFIPHVPRISSDSSYIFEAKKLRVTINQLPENKGISPVKKSLEAKQVWGKLKFVPVTNNANEQLSDLTSHLGRAITSINGENAAWVRTWIEKRGILTLENRQRQQVSNRERLNTWVGRYLSKQKTPLKKGETYYFSKDLGTYLLMDYYKKNGEPIFTEHPASPCTHFLKEFPGMCDQ